MAKITEHRLPSELRMALAAEAPPLEAVLLATVDERTYPHFALLSYLELLLVEEHLYLLLYGGSRTAGFLARSGRCALAFAGGPGVFYIKADASEHRRIDSLIVYRIDIREIERDFPGPGEEGAAVVSGIGFSLPESSLARRTRLRDQLRRLLCGSSD